MRWCVVCCCNFFESINWFVDKWYESGTRTKKKTLKPLKMRNASFIIANEMNKTRKNFETFQLYDWQSVFILSVLKLTSENPCPEYKKPGTNKRHSNKNENEKKKTKNYCQFLCLHILFRSASVWWISSRNRATPIHAPNILYRCCECPGPQDVGIVIIVNSFLLFQLFPSTQFYPTSFVRYSNIFVF